MKKLYVNNRLSFPVESLGPGKRVVIWVEGCTLRCKGCISHHLKKRRSKPVDILFLAEQILKFNNIADGLTISGGEPFQQPDALLELITGVRNKSNIDILIYSGYTIKEIKSGSESMNKLVDNIDILIDGRFEINNSNILNWRGSDNQKVYLLSEKSKKYRSEINLPFPQKRQVYVQQMGNDELRIIGIPTRQYLSEFKQRLLNRGITLREDICRV